MQPGIRPPAAGGMNRAGRLVSRANAGVKPLFSSRLEKRGEKGGLNPHGYCRHVALPNTTSLRTFRLLGRLASGRRRGAHSVTTESIVVRCAASPKPNHQREPE
jgi:hypothetical protein